MYVLIPILTLALSACTGGSSGSSGTGSSSIQGAVILGPVQGGTVRMYAISAATGAIDLTQSLASAITDIDGKFTINTPAGATGPIALQLTGGTYVEEGSGRTVTLSNSSITALIPNPAGTTSAAISPLTEISFQRFSQLTAANPNQGTDIKELIALTNGQVSRSFGVTDVVSIVPANPYKPIPVDASGQYAIVLAGISAAAASLGTDSIALTNAYAASFKASGQFNAITWSIKNSRGDTVALAPPSISQLSTTINRIISGQLQIDGMMVPPGIPTPTMSAVPPRPPPTPPPTPHPQINQSSRVNILLRCDCFDAATPGVNFVVKTTTTAPDGSKTEKTTSIVEQSYEINLPTGSNRRIDVQIRVTNPLTAVTRTYDGHANVSITPYMNVSIDLEELP